MPIPPPLVIDRSAPFSFGVKLALVGALGAAGSHSAYRRWGSSGEWAELMIAVTVAGVAVFIVGIVTLLWRSQVVLNASNGTGMEWNGALVPMRRSRFRLRDVKHVTFSRDTFSTRNSSHTIYAARLEGLNKPVVLMSDTNGFPVRQAAERAARYLAVPLNDETTDANTQEP